MSNIIDKRMMNNIYSYVRSLDPVHIEIKKREKKVIQRADFWTLINHKYLLFLNHQ